MTDPYIRRLETYLRALEKRLVDVDQRVARILLRGKVTEIREAQNDWQVRLEIGRDPETDEPVMSPWVPVQPASAGDLKIKVKPTVGEGMALFSPSGTVGSGSWAFRSPFDDDHPAPQGQEDLILERGNSRIVVKDGLIRMKSADTEVELKSGHLNLVGNKVHTVGDTHLAVGSKDQTAEKEVVVKGLLDTPKVYAALGPLDPKAAEIEAAAAAAAAAAAGGGGSGGSA
jgi:phage baseplate assembly protein gpV